MGMAWLQLQRIISKGGANLMSAFPHSTPTPYSSYCSRFFSKSSPYAVKVGIPEFLHGIGKGVESHAAKLESEIGDFQKLLVTRTLKLKKLGLPCKHRKLILKYTHKYRLGLWRPRRKEYEGLGVRNAFIYFMLAANESKIKHVQPILMPTDSTSTKKRIHATCTP
ncbi:hypothetical protein CR513_44842, partial [Mucuna pruriens]